MSSSTDPRVLASPEELAILAQDQQGTSVALHVKLLLLQPLSNAQVLQASRNPGSKFIRDAAGNKCGPSNDEYLDLSYLGKSWRTVWLDFLRNTTPASIAFDGALPVARSEAGDEQKIRWDIDPHESGGIYVMQRDFQILAITLATEARMCLKGDIKLYNANESLQGWHLKSLKEFEEHLQKLSNYKR